MEPDYKDLQRAVAKANRLIREYAAEHPDTKEVYVRLHKDPDGPGQLQVDIVHLHARLM